jgi:hypothetical protein
MTSNNARKRKLTFHSKTMGKNDRGGVNVDGLKVGLPFLSQTEKEGRSFENEEEWVSWYFGEGMLMIEY